MAAGTIEYPISADWSLAVSPAAGASVMLRATGGHVFWSLSGDPTGAGALLSPGDPPLTVFGGRTASGVTLPPIYAMSPKPGCKLVASTPA